MRKRGEPRFPMSDALVVIGWQRVIGLPQGVQYALAVAQLI